MNKTYLAVKRVLLVAASTYIESGDILVHDLANNGNLTVYRDQKIIATIKGTVVGIKGMLRAEIIKLIDDVKGAEAAALV
jgi:hypothetical protein